MTREKLEAAGCGPREVRAALARVPSPILAAVPREILRDLAAGIIPKRGCGLGSDTGTGKTMAVASLVAGFMRRRLESYARNLPAKAAPGVRLTMGAPLVWVCWPDAVDIIRTHAIDGGAEALLQRAEGARLLVLDDLGRERIRGKYTEDWAASQLDRLVNHRYRHELPTIWTTNLQEPALTAIYGAALVSRLTEDAPLAWLEGLPSMRIQ